MPPTHRTKSSEKKQTTISSFFTRDSNGNRREVIRIDETDHNVNPYRATSANSNHGNQQTTTVKKDKKVTHINNGSNTKVDSTTNIPKREIRGGTSQLPYEISSIDSVQSDHSFRLHNGNGTAKTPIKVAAPKWAAAQSITPIRIDDHSQEARETWRNSVPSSDFRTPKGSIGPSAHPSSCDNNDNDSDDDVYECEPISCADFDSLLEFDKVDVAVLDISFNSFILLKPNVEFAAHNSKQKEPVSIVLSETSDENPVREPELSTAMDIDEAIPLASYTTTAKQDTAGIPLQASSVDSDIVMDNFEPMHQDNEVLMPSPARTESPKRIASPRSSPRSSPKRSQQKQQSSSPPRRRISPKRSPAATAQPVKEDKSSVRRSMSPKKIVESQSQPSLIASPLSPVPSQLLEWTQSPSETRDAASASAHSSPLKRARRNVISETDEEDIFDEEPVLHTVSRIHEDSITSGRPRIPRSPPSPVKPSKLKPSQKSVGPQAAKKLRPKPISGEFCMPERAISSSPELPDIAPMRSTVRRSVNTPSVTTSSLQALVKQKNARVKKGYQNPVDIDVDFDTYEMTLKDLEAARNEDDQLQTNLPPPIVLPKPKYSEPVRIPHELLMSMECTMELATFLRNLRHLGSTITQRNLFEPVSKNVSYTVVVGEQAQEEDSSDSTDDWTHFFARFHRAWKPTAIARRKNIVPKPNADTNELRGLIILMLKLQLDSHLEGNMRYFIDNVKLFISHFPENEWKTKHLPFLIETIGPIIDPLHCQTLTLSTLASTSERCMELQLGLARHWLQRRTGAASILGVLNSKKFIIDSDTDYQELIDLASILMYDFTAVSAQRDLVEIEKIGTAARSTNSRINDRKMGNLDRGELKMHLTRIETLCSLLKPKHGLRQSSLKQKVPGETVQ